MTLNSYKDVREILEELREMRGREMQQEKKKKERKKKLSAEMEKTLDLNKKYCEEIHELTKQNEKLRSMVEKRRVKVDEGKMYSEIKDLAKEEVKSWKGERERRRLT